MYEYRGRAAIYLQGRDALEAILPINQNVVEYYVGSPESQIQIRDYRKAAADAAQQALNGHNMEQFADIFSTPSDISIVSTDRSTRIEIEESSGEGSGNDGLLWLGVIEGNEISAHEVYWELFKPIEQNKIAFAAMVVV